MNPTESAAHGGVPQSSKSRLGFQQAPGSPERAGSMPGWKEILLVASVGVIFGTIWAVRVGQDVGWDQRNYHYYSVYAWLTGRVTYHIAPAAQQTWYNPLIYLPYYWLMSHVRPVVAGGIFGACAGLNLAVVYILARLVLPLGDSRWRSPIALLCCAVGFCDPFFMEFIGTTDADNIVSLPVVASLCILCWVSVSGVESKSKNRAYAIAGLLLGAASGLKWTCFVFALAMGLTLIVLWPVLRLTLPRLVWFSAGGLLGFLSTGGYWSWFLWTRYGNPFFPHWNRTFHSPWAHLSNFRDMRFPPASAEAALLFPFQWMVGIHPTSEDAFRDARFAVLAIFLFVIGAALIGQWIARRWEPGSEAAEPNLHAAPQHCWLLLTFSVISYLLWLKTFSIQRYLVPLSVVTGLLLWLVLDWLIRGRTAKITAFIFLAAFCLLWTRVDLSGDRVPYGADWYRVNLAPEVQTPDTLFIMVGGGALGYIVPFLPDSARAVRVDSIMTPESDTEMVRHAKEVIARHNGPIRSLSVAPLQEHDYAQISRFGLELDETACAQFHTVTDQFTTCRMTPAATGSQQKTSQPPGRN